MKNISEREHKKVSESLGKGSETGFKLIMLALIEFLYSLFLAFMIFGIVDTFQFITQDYVSPFWIVTLFIFIVIFALNMVAISLSKR